MPSGATFTIRKRRGPRGARARIFRGWCFAPSHLPPLQSDVAPRRFFGDIGLQRTARDFYVELGGPFPVEREAAEQGQVRADVTRDVGKIHAPRFFIGGCVQPEVLDDRVRDETAFRRHVDLPEQELKRCQHSFPGSVYTTSRGVSSVESGTARFLRPGRELMAPHPQPQPSTALCVHSPPCTRGLPSRKAQR